MHDADGGIQDSSSFVRYFAPGPEESVWGLTVTGLGHTVIPAGAAYPPHLERHPRSHALCAGQIRRLHSWQLILISAGRGWLSSAQAGDCSIEAGQLIWLLPEEPHRYAPDPTTGWTETYVECQGPQLQHVHARHLRAADPVWTLSQPPVVQALFDDLIRSLQRSEPYLRERLATSCSRLVMECLTQWQQRRFANDDNLPAVSRAQQLLQERARRRVDLTALARELGLSEHRFRRAFKRLTGQTAQDYLTHQRLALARSLLRDGDLDLATIASRSGFCNAFYLARQCRRHLGCTPSELRHRA